MKKEKKIKINYVRYIKKHYVPSTSNLKTWIRSSLMKSFINHVNLIFVGQKRMRTLNSTYLKKDKSTTLLDVKNKMIENRIVEYVIEKSNVKTLNMSFSEIMDE